MINQQVTDDIEFLLSLIFSRNLLYIITSSFAIYFAWQKLTRKVYASFTISQSKIYESHISSLTLSNKRDNIITVSSIRYVMENGSDIELDKPKEPLLIKAHETQVIAIDKYSYLLDSDGRDFTPSFPPFHNGQIHLIDISGKRIVCTSKQKATPTNPNIDKITRRFNGVVLTPKIKYIFTYSIGGKEGNLLIDNSGFIDSDTGNGGSPFHFNKLSNDYVEDIKLALIQIGYHEIFDNYILAHIENSSFVNMVFKKSDIEMEKRKNNPHEK